MSPSLITTTTTTTAPPSTGPFNSRASAKRRAAQYNPASVPFVNGKMNGSVPLKNGSHPTAAPAPSVDLPAAGYAAPLQPRINVNFSSTSMGDSLYTPTGMSFRQNSAGLPTNGAYFNSLTDNAGAGFAGMLGNGASSLLPQSTLNDAALDTRANLPSYNNNNGNNGKPGFDTSLFDPTALASRFRLQYFRFFGKPKTESLPLSQPNISSSPTSTSTASSIPISSFAQQALSSLPTLRQLTSSPALDTLRFCGLCVLWYSASAVTNNIGKQILNQFRYPVTLTWVQFGFVALYCFIFGNVFGMSKIRWPTKENVITTLPLAVFQIVGHVFSSVAISRIPVSFVHTVKALSPLFTVLFYRFLFKIHYSSKVYLALLPLTLGVMLACTFAFTNNVIGLLCALGSCLVFVTQNIFSKKLLFKEQSERRGTKLDKMNMLFLSSSMAFVLMFPLWLYSDGFDLLGTSAHSSSAATAGLTSTVITYFFLNGSSHFTQNIFAFNLLAMTSPVTYSIASLVKRIFVIVASIVWFGQQVSGVQWVGIVLTFLGLWMYQSAKRDVERGESKVRERELGEVLPTHTEGSEQKGSSWMPGFGMTAGVGTGAGSGAAAMGKDL